MKIYIKTTSPAHSTAMLVVVVIINIIMVKYRRLSILPSATPLRWQKKYKTKGQREGFKKWTACHRRWIVTIQHSRGNWKLSGRKGSYKNQDNLPKRKARVNVSTKDWGVL